MVTVTRRPDGTYSIEGGGGPAFLVVTTGWLNGLLLALQELGMIEQDGVRLTKPARR